MRGAGIDHTGVRVRDQRSGFLRGRIRQTQERDIGRIEQAGALVQILAQVGIDAQHLDIGTRGEYFIDAQAGRAVLSVDEYLGGHDCVRLPEKRIEKASGSAFHHSKS